jgi:hypothetical protein
MLNNINSSRTQTHRKIVKFWKNITTYLTITGCEYLDWILLAKFNVRNRLGMFREQ